MKFPRGTLKGNVVVQVFFIKDGPTYIPFVFLFFLFVKNKNISR